MAENAIRCIFSVGRGGWAAVCNRDAIKPSERKLVPRVSGVVSPHAHPVYRLRHFWPEFTFDQGIRAYHRDSVCVYVCACQVAIFVWVVTFRFVRFVRVRRQVVIEMCMAVYVCVCFCVCKLYVGAWLRLCVDVIRSNHGNTTR